MDILGHSHNVAERDGRGPACVMMKQVSAHPTASQRDEPRTGDISIM